MQAKQHTVLIRCPICRGEMVVRELECPSCEVVVRGNFGAATSGSAGLGRFQGLTPEQSAFLETFLSCRGIIKDVEAALGISYPTVRARLDGLLSALGLAGGAIGADRAVSAASAASAASGPTMKHSVKEILSKLDSGAIDAQSALDAVQGNRTGDGSK